MTTKKEPSDRYHTFALVLVQLDVEAPLRDTGDYAVEYLSQALRHKLYLLVLDAGTFGIGCNLLHVAGVVAEVLVLLLRNTASAIQIFGQQAVHHHVRETADG